MGHILGPKMLLRLATLLGAISSRSEARFLLYNGRNLITFAAEKGVSEPCMAALNTTLDCFDGFLERALQQEAFVWKAENLTVGCTQSCRDDLKNWVGAVQSNCHGAAMIHEGMMINPVVLPIMYQYNHDLACLRDDSSWCLLESQAWVGSEIPRYPADLCETGHRTWDADICFTPGFDQMAIEKADTRLSNLYDKSLLCSPCFLDVFHKRLLSPLLKRNYFTDYLVEQLDDMERLCSTKMPLSMPTSSWYLGTKPLPTRATASVTSPVVTAMATACMGTLIHPPARYGGCEALAKQYNVTSGDLVVLSGDWDCHLSKPICAPPPCQLMRIGWGETCETLRVKMSTKTENVTLVQFSDWNPRIIGTCEDLQIWQYICASPPGGKYVPPPPVYAPTKASNHYTTALPARPTSKGTTPSCGKFYQVVEGDTCQGIVLQSGITMDDFYRLNKQVSHDCSNLWLGYSYCVAPVNKAPISTDGKCGPDAGHATCTESKFGDCCSYWGSCGTGNAYCATGSCYSGACEGVASSVSKDGTCGPHHDNWLCGGPWGNCCSIYGYCGNSSDFCGAGLCYSGACNTDLGAASIDGSCGPKFAGNKTCAGTQFGECCSKRGYCGDGADYCSPANCYSGACKST